MVDMVTAHDFIGDCIFKWKAPKYEKRLKLEEFGCYFLIFACLVVFWLCCNFLDYVSPNFCLKSYIGDDQSASDVWSWKHYINILG